MVNMAVICYHPMASEACFHHTQLFQIWLFLLLVLLLWFIWVSNKDALFAVSETINDFCHHITSHHSGHLCIPD